MLQDKPTIVKEAICADPNATWSVAADLIAVTLERKYSVSVHISMKLLAETDCPKLGP